LNKTEQLSYFAQRDKEMVATHSTLLDLLNVLKDTGSLPNISTGKLQEFKETLETIVGDKNSIFMYGNSMIDRLLVPLNELKEFQAVLSDLAGWRQGGILYPNAPLQKLTVPVSQLKEFKILLDKIVGDKEWMLMGNSPISRLVVPLNELEMYNNTLDKTLEKLKEIKALESGTMQYPGTAK
jgi:hypothetical protein